MMTDLNMALAPGCFGLGLVFRAHSKECSTCPFAARCEPLATKRLAEVRSSLGIVERQPKKPKVRSPAAVSGTMTPELPTKVAELLARIERAGIKVTEALARNENPFRTIAFMRVTCHLLLHLGSIKRDTLQRALMSKLEWSAGTAAAHAMQASQLLQALGAATETNGTINLIRS